MGIWGSHENLKLPTTLTCVIWMIPSQATSKNYFNYLKGKCFNSNNNGMHLLKSQITLYLPTRRALSAWVEAEWKASYPRFPILFSYPTFQTPQPAEALILRKQAFIHAVTEKVFAEGLWHSGDALPGARMVVNQGHLVLTFMNTLSIKDWLN